MMAKQKKETVTWGPQCAFEDELDKFFENQTDKSNAMRFLLIQHIIQFGTGDMANYLPRKISKKSIEQVKFPGENRNAHNHEECQNESIAESDDEYIEDPKDDVDIYAM